MVRNRAQWHTRPPYIAVPVPGVDQTPPTAPTLTNSAPTATTIPLSWSGATDNVGVTSYNIYLNGQYVASTAASPYTLTGLTPSTQYSAYVKALDAAGNVSPPSNTINAQTIGQSSDTTPPTAPTLVAGTPTATTIPLTWSGATDNVAVTSYDVYRGTLKIANVANSPYTDVGLNPSTGYSYTVRALDAAGNQSPASNTVSATTSAAAGAITFVAASAAASTTDSPTSLAWSLPTGTQGQDLMMAWVTTANVTPTAPSGWTTSVVATQGTATKCSFFWRVAGGTAGSATTDASTATWTGLSSTTAISGLSLRSENASTPINVTATAVNGSVTSITPGTLSPASTDMVVICAGTRPDAAGNQTITMPTTASWTHPSGGDANSTNSFNFPSRSALAYKINGSDTPSITASAACEWAVVSVAVSAGGSGGSGGGQTVTGKSVVFSAPFTDANNWTRGKTSAFPSNGPTNTGDHKLDYISPSNYPVDGQTFKAVKRSGDTYWDADLVTTEYSTGGFLMQTGDSLTCTITLNSPVGAWPAIWTWKSGDNEIDSFEYHPDHPNLLELTNHLAGTNSNVDSIVTPGTAFDFRLDVNASSVVWYVNGTSIFNDGKGAAGWSAYLIVNMSVSDGFYHPAPANSNTLSWSCTNFKIWRLGAGGPTGPTGTWNLVFQDEFNGTTLDLTKWRPNWLGPSDTAVTVPVQTSDDAAYDPAQVSVSGGYLHLTTVSNPILLGGKTYPYRSGMIQGSSKGNYYTYGAFEAKIYLPASSGQIANWPAWWWDGDNWPTTGEIDIMEGLGGSAAWHFHYDSGGGTPAATGAGVAGDFTGWHIYTVEWKAGQIDYYYDGNLVGSVTSHVTSSPMYPILNYAMNTTYGGPEVVGDTMLVEYVRIWQR